MTAAKVKFRQVTVRYKNGEVFCTFGSILMLGFWLFSKRKRTAREVALLRRLRLSHTLVERASRAYVAWLVGRSRIRPRGR